MNINNLSIIHKAKSGILGEVSSGFFLLKDYPDKNSAMQGICNY